jgi:hypothetical protein
MTKVACGKHKKIAIKKRKRTPTKAELAQAVADTANLAEREVTEAVRFTLVSVAFILKVDSLVQRPLRRQDLPAEQPTEETEETKEQTVQTPPRRRSGRTRAQVTPRLEGQ